MEPVGREELRQELSALEERLEGGIERSQADLEEKMRKMQAELQEQGRDMHTELLKAFLPFQEQVRTR